MISPEKSAASFLPATEAPSKRQVVVPQKQEADYAALISNEPKTKLKNILVAQLPPEGPRSPYFDLQARYKVKFTFEPFITVEGLPGKEFRKQRLTLNDFSGIIFTSRNSIDHFLRRIFEEKLIFLKAFVDWPTKALRNINFYQKDKVKKGL